MRGSAIDYHLIKATMKKLNLQAEYYLIPCILREWYGIVPLQLSSMEIAELHRKFETFEELFNRQRKRKNFLNYFWLIQKFLLELGLSWHRVCNLPSFKDCKKSKTIEALYAEICSIKS
jgi:hypothetical protein